MKNFFPDPYPGELLYSVIARYHHLNAGGRVDHTMRELCGSNSCYVPIVDFPRHISNLIEQIPFYSKYDMESLLNNHTVLPYYFPFLPDANRAQIVELMTSNKKGVIHTKVGHLSKSLQRSHSLKYCSDCIFENIQKYGEPFWHTIHQAPGNFYCVHHDKVLSTGCEDCGFSFIPKNKRLIILGQYCPNCESDLSFQNQGWNSLIASNKAELMKISIEINHLIRSHDQWTKWSFSNWKIIYLKRLKELNFCTHNNQVRHAKLQSFFERYYSKEFLALLMCSLDFSNWLKACIKSDHAIHPLKHILLIKFLFGSLDELSKYKLNDTGEKVVCLTRKREQKGKETYRNIARQKLDWSTRDEQLCYLVKQAHERLCQKPSKPIRITLNRICEEVGYKGIQINLNKLPKTAKLLDRLLENRKEYQVRLVKWHFHANHLANNESVQNIMRRLSSRIRKDGEIHSRILQELRELKKGA